MDLQLRRWNKQAIRQPPSIAASNASHLLVSVTAVELCQDLHAQLGPDEMASVFTFLNRLLPFATPGTPLLQDLAHLGALCLLLYLGPRIQDTLRARYLPNQPNPNDVPTNNASEAENPIPEPQNNEPAFAPAQNNELPQVGEPGPAPPEVQDDNNWDNNNNNDDDPPANRDIPQTTNRNIGAKKAKSLARKDQRRAYHEFQRAQGEAQRARDAENAEEREALLAAERERRRAAEEVVGRKKAEERERRREKEEREREEEQRRREMVVELVREGLSEEGPGRVDLFAVAGAVGRDVDEQWVERIVEGSGVLDVRDEDVRFITGTGWAVRVSREEMLRVYEQVMKKDDGQFDHRQLADLLVAAKG